MYHNIVFVMVAVFSTRLWSGLSFGLFSPRTAPHRNCYSSARQCSQRWLRSNTMSLAAPPAPVAKESGLASLDCRVLEELASSVVRGIADKVVPAGSRLKRRRSWDLFLEPADCPEVAVLVINKKSSFTLDDAHTTLALMEEEVAARRQPCSSNPLRQLLLATRAGVAPAADVFIRGMQDRSSSENCATVVVQWEQLAGLVEDRTLGRFLDGSTELLRKPAAFALPQWLADERERERRAGGKRLFELRAPFEPAGDQPEAIEALARGLAEGKRHQTLLGATGTGKTFIIANVIEKASLPTLVLAPNKVLAAQLTNELRALFPNNAVEYFVSYYDYFMPEAFNSVSDTYIDKVVLVNDDIDRMRHSATRSLLERRDVIVVASVSCIYGLGMPSKYLGASIRIAMGQDWSNGWRTLVRHLEKDLSYEAQHSDEEFWALPRGKFRVVSVGADAGGVVEIGPAADEAVIRVAMDAAGVVTRVQFVPTIEGTGGGGSCPQGLAAVLSSGGVTSDMGGEEMQTAPWLAANTTRDGRDVEAHVIYPAKHHVVAGGEMERVLEDIENEMEERCTQLGVEGRVLEAERLRQRTENDIMLLRAVGTCKGVENYSRHLAARQAGDPPETLMDYFPDDDWLLVVDESHVSSPQLGAMWAGNQARKMKLVEHGFRLPSALDNRPLKAGEFWSKVNKTIFLSATPGKFELELSNPGKQRLQPIPPTAISSTDDAVREQQCPATDCRSGKPTGRALGWDLIGDLVDAQTVIRPTGITDPPVDIRPSEGQVADLVQECRTRGKRDERVLVTALTKRMAEDLCAFLVEQGVPTAYLHSDVKPMHRLELLRQLRCGEVDVIVGVNLLREGLNLPEVSLVCILDADAEGFLRSDTALLQTIGRATRHQAGRAVLYADRITPSMRRALAETDRRRDIQMRHNKLHRITPSVATAASVGDSLLDSIGIKQGEGSPGQPRDQAGGADAVVNGMVSWAEPFLPPDQVQVLYDLAARNSGGRTSGRSLPAPHETSSLATLSPDAGAIAPIAAALPPSKDARRALKRLAEQAAEKMALAAGRTEFKEAALWRDRRDVLLSTMAELKQRQDEDVCVAVESETEIDGVSRVSKVAMMRELGICS